MEIPNWIVVLCLMVASGYYGYSWVYPEEKKLPSAIIAQMKLSEATNSTDNVSALPDVGFGEDMQSTMSSVQQMFMGGLSPGEMNEINKKMMDTFSNMFGPMQPPPKLNNNKVKNRLPMSSGISVIEETEVPTIEDMKKMIANGSALEISKKEMKSIQDGARKLATQLQRPKKTVKNKSTDLFSSNKGSVDSDSEDDDLMEKMKKCRNE